MIRVITIIIMQLLVGAVVEVRRVVPARVL